MKGPWYAQISPILDISKGSQVMCEEKSNATKMVPLPLGLRKQKPRPVCLKPSFAGIPRWIPLLSTKYFLLRNRIYCLVSLETAVYSVSDAYFSRIVIVVSASASPGKERRQSGGRMKRKTVFPLKLMDTETVSHKAGHFP